jgi:murein hydrolase activator
VAELRSQRSVIEADIARKRAAARELEERIRRLIAAADQRAAGAREEFDAAAYAALTGSFNDNRGRLPWPVRGVVREPFGNIINPVYGTTTPNPGILIDTQPQADVRAVFEGMVVDVDVMPDYGTIVVIQHGEYRSVYSNFSALYVELGDYVSAGQSLGRAGTPAEPKGPALFFAIFRSGEAIDPAPWLQRL